MSQHNPDVNEDLISPLHTVNHYLVPRILQEYQQRLYLNLELELVQHHGLGLGQYLGS